jgi:hypothetical protein
MVVGVQYSLYLMAFKIRIIKDAAKNYGKKDKVVPVLNQASHHEAVSLCLSSKS